MLFFFVGEEKFRNSLKLFYSRFKHSHADTDDLVQVFSEICQIDLSRFFQQWIRQPGFPIVFADSRQILNQARFTNKKLIHNQTWTIPLSLVYSVNNSINREKILFSTQKLKLPIPADFEWFFLNSENRSFCRIFYEGLNFEKIKNAIKHKSLGRMDRDSFLNDYNAFANAGLLSYSKMIEILNLYVNETDVLVSKSCINIFNNLLNLFPDVRSELLQFGIKLFLPMLHRIGKIPQENEKITISQLRLSLLNVLGVVCEYKEIADFGLTLFDDFKSNGTIFDSNFLSFIIRSGAKHSETDFIYELIATHKSPEIRLQAILSLGFVPETKHQESIEYLDKAKLQDAVYVFRGLSLGSIPSSLLWGYLKTHYQELKLKFGEVGYILPIIIESSVSDFHSFEEAHEVETFFDQNPTPVCELQIKQVIEKIYQNAEINKRDFPQIRETLQTILHE